MSKRNKYTPQSNVVYDSLVNTAMLPIEALMTNYILENIWKKKGKCNLSIFK